MNHNLVMVKIKGNKERITKIRHGMIGHHERVKIHVKNGKNVTHSTFSFNGSSVGNLYP